MKKKGHVVSSAQVQNTRIYSPNEHSMPGNPSTFKMAPISAAGNCLTIFKQLIIHSHRLRHSLYFIVSQALIFLSGGHRANLYLGKATHFILMGGILDFASSVFPLACCGGLFFFSPNACHLANTSASSKWRDLHCVQQVTFKATWYSQR